MKPIVIAVLFLMFSYNIKASQLMTYNPLPVKLDNGEYGRFQVQINDNFKYRAVIQKVEGKFDQKGGSGYIKCESKVNGVWHEVKSGIYFEGLGLALDEKCWYDGLGCLKVKFDKKIPVLGGNSIKLEKPFAGKISYTGLKKCK